jgi:hypothetical protein
MRRSNKSPDAPLASAFPNTPTTQPWNRVQYGWDAGSFSNRESAVASPLLHGCNSCAARRRLNAGNFLLMGGWTMKMSFDTDEYLSVLRTYKKIQKLQTIRDAEMELFPIRAKKRELMRRERIELAATCITKRRNNVQRQTN